MEDLPLYLGAVCLGLYAGWLLVETGDCETGDFETGADMGIGRVSSDSDVLSASLNAHAAQNKHSRRGNQSQQTRKPIMAGEESSVLELASNAPTGAGGATAAGAKTPGPAVVGHVTKDVPFASSWYATLAY